MLPPPQMLAIKNRLANKWILFLALTFILAGCTPPGPRALLAGKRLIEKGRYEKAIAELRTATSLLPTNAQAWNYLGVAYHHAGKFENAVEAYKRALALNHDLAEARYNLGCLMLDQNNLDAARTEFTTFTLQRGNSAEGWLKLGETQLRSRNMNSAVKCFNEVLRLSPRQSEALNGLGLVLVQRGKARQAVQYFAAAVRNQPDYAPALLNLAVVHQTYLHDSQDALKNYRAYLALKPRPENATAVESLVRVLEQKNVAATQSKPTVALATQPARNAEANQHSEPDRGAESAKPPLSAPQVVSKPKPESVPSVGRVTQPNPIVARVEPAPRIERQTIPSTKDSTTNADSVRGADRTITTAAALSKVASETGAASYQRYSYHSLPELKPGDHAQGEQYFAKGAEAYRIGRYADAAQAYRVATQLDPAYFDAYYNLGVAASKAGNLQQSLDAYEYALAVKPDSVNARYNFALTLNQANYPLDAAAQLQKILTNNQGEARAHLALANLYARQFHDVDKAREQYLKVLQYDPSNSQGTAIRFWLKSHPR